MFGPPGVAYVYLVYGMYDCLNVVTGPEGTASAVLIRAVEPLDGVERMRTARLAVSMRRRAGRCAAGIETASTRLAATPDRRLASGPGLVAASFGVDTSWTGRDLCTPGAPLRLERDPNAAADQVADSDVLATPRIGVGYAGPDWSGRPWRFTIAGHRSVSGPAAR